MVIVADKTRTDGTAFNFLSRFITKMPILLLSRVEQLDFNDEIISLKSKDYCIVDYIENGWNWDRQETLIVGQNTMKFFEGEGWQKLHDFVNDNPPNKYLKRELLKKDESNYLKPIEYPNFQPSYQIESREEFNKRPISIFNFWGRSHEARLIFQGEIWKHAARKGYAVCDNIFYFNHFMEQETNPNKWLSFWMAHYVRIDIKELLQINAMSKLSLSLPGAGIKCFRTTGESIVNSVMIMPEDNLAYSHEFIDGYNCIKFPIEDVTGLQKEWQICERIEEALKMDNLYDIYLKGLEAAEFYQIKNYIPYLENIINS